MSDRIEVFNQSIKSPARVFTWDVEFPAISGGPAIDVPKIRAQSANIPGLAISEIELHNWGLPIKYAGQVRYDNRFDLNFAEDEDYQVFNYLQAWRALIVDLSTTHVKDKSNYQKTVSLILYDVEEYGTALKTFVFSHMWPSNIGAVTLDKSNATTAVRFVVTFTYDYYRIV